MSLQVFFVVSGNPRLSGEYRIGVNSNSQEWIHSSGKYLLKNDLEQRRWRIDIKGSLEYFVGPVNSLGPTESPWQQFNPVNKSYVESRIIVTAYNERTKSGVAPVNPMR